MQNTIGISLVPDIEATKLDKIETLLQSVQGLMADMTVSDLEDNIKSLNIKNTAFLLRRK